MKTHSRFCLSLAVAAVVFGICLRPASAQEPPNVTDYIDPAYAYHTSNFDYADVLNHRLALDIPLFVDHSQRGNLNFTWSLRYASTTVWIPAYQWTPPNGTISSVDFSMDGKPTFGLDCTDDYCTTSADYALDDNGAKHYLGTTSSIPQVGESVDGSGIRWQDNTGGSGTIINRQGVRFYENYNSGEDGTVITDPNGNLITFNCENPVSGSCFTHGTAMKMTDTLGRLWRYYYYYYVDTSGCPGTPNRADLWEIPGPNGQMRHFKFCYSNVAISTNFGSPGVYEYSGIQVLMTAVFLPDGTNWQFNYDNYGDISSIILPTGGTVTYGWSSGRDGYGDAVRVLTSRQAFDGTNTSTWYYNGFAVTDPAGNDTVYNPVGNVTCDERLSSIQYYSGSGGSRTLLKTVSPGNQVLDNPYPQDLGGCTVTYLRTGTQTQWSNGQTNAVTPAYDSGFTFTDDNNGSQHHGVYGLVIQENDYDYGNGAPGSVLKTTNTTYKALSSDSDASSYLSANVLDKQCLVTTYGPGSVPSQTSCINPPSVQANQAAQTTYKYDEANGSPSGVRGNLTSVTRWLNGGTSPKTQYVYNGNGMQITMIDPKGNSTQYTYDGTGAFLSQIQYPSTGSVQHIKHFSFDSNTGLMTQSTDENGTSNPTNYSYDCMVRPYQITYPDGGQENVTYNYSGGAGCTGTTGLIYAGATQTKKINASQTLSQNFLYDGLGRLTQTQNNSDTEGVTYTDIAYDSLGRTYTVSNPHRSASSLTDGTSTYKYDALSRTTEIDQPDGGSKITATYTGNCTTATDEAGKTRKSCADGLGRITGLWEDPSGLNYQTSYTYDPLGNLTSVAQTGGSRQRTFTYDPLSRLTSSNNPETGIQGFAYDNNGNLRARTDARGITTTYTYDALNRLKGKTYSDTTPAVTFTYDVSSINGLTISNPVGRLVQSLQASPCAGIINSYDSMGRTTSQWQYNQFVCGGGHGGVDYRLDYTYNLAGDVTSETNGEGVTISYGYDAADRLSSISSSLVDANHPSPLATVDPTAGYWPFGGIQKLALGNGLTEAVAYDNRLQPCHINVNSSGANLTACIGVPSGNVRDFSATFNAGSSDNGTIASWTATGAQSLNRTYTYDHLNRLQTMSSPGDPSGCTGYSWTFDQWGNRTAQTGTSGTNCNQPSTGYNTRNQISSPPGYVYDANGNLTNDTVHAYTYDAENRLVSVDGGATASYIYSADGRRLQKTVGSTALTYLYDLSGNVVAEDNGTSWGPGYVYLGNQLLALYSNGTTYFVHADHLGSSRVLTAVNQSVYDQPDYLPFGEQIAGDTGTSHKFTGYPRDAETGLDYASARYYGSLLGRFLTPDPLGMRAADPTNPQSWNQYAYVTNNPLNLTDPTGTDPWDEWGGGFGGGDCIWCELPPSIPQIGGGGPPGLGGVPGISIPTNPDGCTYGSGSCGGMIYGFGAGNGSPQWSSYPAYLDWLQNALTLAGSILISPIGHCYGGDAICIPGQAPRAAANIQSDNATNFAAAGAVEAVGESGVFDAFQGINDNPLFRVGPGYKEMPDGTVERIWRFASGGRWGKGGFKLPWHWHWP